MIKDWAPVLERKRWIPSSVRSERRSNRISLSRIPVNISTARSARHSGVALAARDVNSAAVATRRRGRSVRRRTPDAGFTARCSHSTANARAARRNARSRFALTGAERACSQCRMSGVPSPPSAYVRRLLRPDSGCFDTPLVSWGSAQVLGILAKLITYSGDIDHLEAGERWWFSFSTLSDSGWVKSSLC